MMRARRFTLGTTLWLATFLAWALPARAQTVQGSLRDRETNQPIGFGRVVLLNQAGDSVATTLSNASGLFSVSAKQAGSFYLRASALGYKETTAGVFDLDQGGSITVEFRIYSAPISLEGVVATLPQDRVRPAALIRNGFYERLTAGMGRFITPAEIDKAMGFKPSELFFGIPRVNVVPNAEGGGNSITMLAPMGDCAPPLYVDGVLVSRAASDMDLPPLSVIEAVEVYRGAAELPLQWSGTAAQGCGAIVVWTKGS